MKELSIEEKARAYDEVREKITIRFGSNVANEIFSELRESEDERIRKWIRKELESKYVVDNIVNNVMADKALAWIEKQADTQKKIDHAYAKGLADAQKALEKQGKNNMGISEATKQELESNLNEALEKETPESCNKFLDKQKPVEWHREDEQNLNACLGYIPDEFLRRWLKDVTHVKYDKPADKVEPKFHEGDMIIHKELGGDYIHNPHKIIQVDILDKKYRLEGGLVAHFSEQEDYELVEQKPADKVEPSIFKDRLLELFQIFRWRCKDHILTNGEILEYVDAHIQELIGTMQKPADTEKGANGNDREIPISAWSEEDEHNLNSVINLVHNTRDGAWGSCVGERIESWLKSLKERYTWKPSGEQMHYLSWIANVRLGDSVVEQEVSKHLNELLEDLKKLREE